MLLDETKISLAFVLAMIALGVVALVGLIGAVVGWVATDDPEDREERRMIVGFFIALPVVWGLITAGFCFPFAMDYHQWRKVEGKVAVAHTRILSGDNGPDEQSVVSFTSGLTVRCDDSRCVPLKPGDDLTLWCIKEWQWASDPGWACRYGGIRVGRVLR